MNFLRDHPFTGIAGSLLAWAGAIGPAQIEIEWWLRALSYIGAVTVSAITTYCLLKGRKVTPRSDENIPDEMDRTE